MQQRLVCNDTLEGQELDRQVRALKEELKQYEQEGLQIARCLVVETLFKAVESYEKRRISDDFIQDKRSTLQKEYEDAI